MSFQVFETDKALHLSHIKTCSSVYISCFLEQETRGNQSGTREAGQKMTNIMVVDMESYVNVEIDMEKNSGFAEVGHDISESCEGLCHVISLFIVLFS